MLVPMPVVDGMAVATVHVVGVIAVRQRLVAAVLAMDVVVIVVDDVGCGIALVPVVVVVLVHVTVMQVVRVAIVVDSHVPAVAAVLVYVLVVDRVGHGHSGLLSVACTTASCTMWDTCSSPSE